MRRAVERGQAEGVSSFRFEVPSFVFVDVVV
jgi:hypothetical protein